MIESPEKDMKGFDFVFNVFKFLGEPCEFSYVPEVYREC